MTTESEFFTVNASQSTHNAGLKTAIAGNGSVAHQIIGLFLEALGKEEGYAKIAGRLQAAIFEGKPTEVGLRAALFGDDTL